MNVKKTFPKRLCDALARSGVDIFYYASLDSTSAEARRYALSHPDCPPTLFVADAQSEGRGRLGRSFFSPEGTGLYMTLLLPRESICSFGRLTALCAVALRGSIESIFKISTGIKWVNDLYINEKKVSGILAESFFSGEKSFVSIGIGVNISTEDFPSELGDVACSLTPGDERKDLKLELACEVCRRIIICLGESDTKKYMDEYRAHSCIIGSKILFYENGVGHEALATGINDEGELLVSVNGEQKVLSSGEISVRKI